jgi:hypothetical protein
MSHKLMKSQRLSDAVTAYSFDDIRGRGLYTMTKGGRVSRPKRYVQPTFAETNYRFDSDQWTGVICTPPLDIGPEVLDAAGPDYPGEFMAEPILQWVTGTWTVPRLVQNGPSDTNTWGAVTWVGFDGYGSLYTTAGQPISPTPLLQAGAYTVFAEESLQTAVSPTGSEEATGVTGIASKAWFEWHPSTLAATISNFDVNPGDTVSVFIQLLSRSSTDPFIVKNLEALFQSNPDAASYASGQLALIYIGNVTSDIYTFFSIANPDPSMAIAGACAEWIVEAPTTVDGLNFDSLMPYGQFGQVIFANAACGTQSSGSILPSTPFFGEAQDPLAAGLIPLTLGSTATTVIDVRGYTASVLLPGLNGPNFIRVTQF